MSQAAKSVRRDEQNRPPERCVLRLASKSTVHSPGRGATITSNGKGLVLTSKSEEGRAKFVKAKTWIESQDMGDESPRKGAERYHSELMADSPSEPLNTFADTVLNHGPNRKEMLVMSLDPDAIVQPPRIGIETMTDILGREGGVVVSEFERALVLAGVLRTHLEASRISGFATVAMASLAHMGDEILHPVALIGMETMDTAHLMSFGSTDISGESVHPPVDSYTVLGDREINALLAQITARQVIRKALNEAFESIPKPPEGASMAERIALVNSVSMYGVSLAIKRTAGLIAAGYAQWPQEEDAVMRVLAHAMKHQDWLMKPHPGWPEIPRKNGLSHVTDAVIECTRYIARFALEIGDKYMRPAMDENPLLGKVEMHSASFTQPYFRVMRELTRLVSGFIADVNAELMNHVKQGDPE